MEYMAKLRKQQGKSSLSQQPGGSSSSSNGAVSCEAHHTFAMTLLVCQLYI
jgi:hypothetical protein